MFAVVDGQLLTPPLDAGLLAGVTRATVLELAAEAGVPAREVALPLSTLYRADEVFTTAPRARSVDDTPVGDGRPGPVTAPTTGSAWRARPPASEGHSRARRPARPDPSAR